MEINLPFLVVFLVLDMVRIRLLLRPQVNVLVLQRSLHGRLLHPVGHGLDGPRLGPGDSLQRARPLASVGGFVLQLPPPPQPRIKVRLENIIVNRLKNNWSKIFHVILIIDR